jgi:hypothetical protein
MKSFTSPLLAFLAALLLSTSSAHADQQSPTTETPTPPEAAASTPPAKPRFTRALDTILNGEWEGSLAMRLPLSATSKRAPPDASDLVLRLVLNGKDAKVYIKDSDKWIEAMPGQFMLAGALTNGTIIGVTGKGPGPGSWIENWAILVTAADDDAMLTEWTRVVNNLEPGESVVPAFSMAAAGTLRRVSK